MKPTQPSIKHVLSLTNRQLQYLLLTDVVMVFDATVYGIGYATEELIFGHVIKAFPAGIE